MISLVVGALGGYAFARLRFRFRRTTLFAFLAIYMLPPIALVIPLYLALANLRPAGHQDRADHHLLLDRHAVLPVDDEQLLPQPAAPTWRTPPGSTAAPRLGALFRVILPLARPGLLTTAMFGFLLAWDEFLYALIFTSTTNAKTIPVAIAEFTGKYSSDFGLIAAGGVLATAATRAPRAASSSATSSAASPPAQ